MERPLLKWVGGKSKIVRDIINSFPKKMNDYHEPFLGGGSVLFAILASDIVIDGLIKASDINPHLINFYISVRDDPYKLSEELRHLVDDPKNETPEAYYYYLRERFNKAPSPALFLFLNRTCFKGLYRESKRGFNAAYGHYKKPLFPSYKQILETSKLIQRVQFEHQDYERSISCVKKGDFVYLDPPYVPLSKTASFVNYVADGFVNHARLFTTCKNLPCSFVMSNSDSEVVLKTFPETMYKIVKIPWKRSLRPGAKDFKVNEVIISASVLIGEGATGI